MDTSYEPPYVHNETGERGATVITVDTGKHANIIANCALVCGACLALCMLCAGIAWWSITQHAVMISNYKAVQADNKAIEKRIDRLEDHNAK